LFLNIDCDFCSTFSKSGIYMNFKQTIQSWVDVDSQVKDLQLKITELREKKQILTTNITQYIEKNNLQRSSISIPDGVLKIVNTNSQTLLTYKYLEKCLHEIIKNEIQVKQIIDYIKKNREITTIAEIKRFSNK